MTSADLERLRDFGRRYAAAWSSQDPAAVAAFFAPDGSLRVNDAEPAVGREAITAVARGFMTDLPDLKVVLDDLVVEGDTVIFRWTLTGTNTGPGGTRRAVKTSGFEEWRMSAGGLVAESLGHLDADDYRRQLDGR